MTTTDEDLSYMRVETLRDGKEFALILQFTTNGVAERFHRGESLETTVRTLRRMADLLELKR